MKKSLLAATTGIVFAGASLTAHAQSSVTLYGIVDAGFNYYSNSHGTQGHFNFGSGGYDGDRWGLKGSEDLGGGLSAIFQVENGFDIGSGKLGSSSTEFNRQAYMGLQSEQYGKLTFGRQYEPTTDLLEGHGPDMGSGGIATYPGDLSDFDNNIRVNNSVKYRSVTYKGLTGEVMYGFGGVAGSMNSGSTAAAGFSYETGPIFVGAVYFRSVNAAPNTTSWSGAANIIPSSSLLNGFNTARSMQFANAVATYTFGKITAGLNYGYTQYRPTGETGIFTHPVAFNSVGAELQYMPIPALALGVGYTYTIGQSVDASSQASKPQIHEVGAKAIYNVTKRTGFYTFWGWSHTSGTTLNDTATGLIDASPVLGDTATGAWSSSRSQAVVQVGMFSQF